MSNSSRREYIEAIRERYHRASKRGKQRILDECCAVCGYHRKYAIRVLNARSCAARSATRHRTGRQPRYADPALFAAVKHLWQVSNLVCSKRLKAMIPLWLPSFNLPLRPETQQQLNTISPATIDRLLARSRRVQTKRGLATTKPGSLLKKHIPIKTNQWDECIPGFLEADTVAHCGASMAGMFVFTVNVVDIATNWTEQRATWGKGEHGTLEALRSIEAALPFRLRGFDCDNGSEFLNWTMLHHYAKRKHPVAYTRAREYHKNDNAHIEEKNWTLIRQYLGYERFDDQQIVALLNDLYTTEWRLLVNFFLPSVKLISKQRVGSRIVKRHDAPKTPLQRVLASPHVSPKSKRELTTLFRRLNPFQLQRCVDKKIRAILSLVSHSRKSKHET